MVEKNYHQAYVNPHCDLCAKDLKAPDLYIRVETAFHDATRTAVHKGHLCEDCNEFDREYVAPRAEQIEYHFLQKEGDAVDLLLVDIKGRQRTRSDLESIWKYGPDEVPEFLRIYAHMIARERGGEIDSDWDHPRIEEFGEQYEEATDRI